MRNSFRIHIALVSGAAFAAAFPARAADDAELASLRAQLAALEQQVKVLARQIELKDDAAKSAAAGAPKVTVNDRGFTLASGDGANAIRLRGLVQLDDRFYFGDHGASANSFVLRRARIIAEGTFDGRFAFQLVPEFGGSSAGILDANLSVRLNDALGFKFGKFKSPVGLELLQSDSWTFFNERSIVTNLVPNRDLGVEASGSLFRGVLSYQAGVFAGVPDGGSSNNTDVDRDVDFAGRAIVAPFKLRAESPLAGLSFGLGGSYGRHQTASGRTSGYKTDGQQAFFAYNSAVVADGAAWRLAPQFDYRQGPLGLLGEYVVSAAELRATETGARTTLQHRGWQLAAGYVLTGEDSSYNGVKPRTAFDWGRGAWGGFEVVARYADLRIDDAAFPLFASPGSNANEASAVGAGVNWYLSNTVAFKIGFYHTRFGFNAAAPATPAAAVLRKDENTLITRFQLSF